MIISGRGVQDQANKYTNIISLSIIHQSHRANNQQVVVASWLSWLTALSHIQHVSHIIMASISTLRRSSSSHYAGVSAHDDANDSKDPTTSTTNGYPGGTAITRNTYIVTE